MINIFTSMKGVSILKDLEKCTKTCGMGWQKEYLPIETLKKDYINARKSGIIITNGRSNDNLIIKIKKNSVPHMEFEVINLKEKADLELPRIFYLGYDILDNEGKKIKYRKNKNGFIEIRIKNNGNYTVEYTGTKLYKISKNISIITLFGYLYIIVYLTKK